MRRSAWAIVAVALGWALPAMAQFAPSGQPNINVPPRPGINSIPAPFPLLPPSNPCGKDDIYGIWKLVRFYEVPADKETSLYAQYPKQYFWFRRDTTFAKDEDQTEIPLPALRMKMRQETKPVRQYVINDSGFIYFYQDSVAVDTQACFIVAKPQGQFQHGEMLLMPPQGTSQVRLVKVYQKQGNNRQVTAGGGSQVGNWAHPPGTLGGPAIQLNDDE